MNIKNLPTLMLAALAGSALLAGCATFDVHTDGDATLVGKVHCHTAAWAGGFRGDSPLRNGAANPLNESRLRDAIAANLERAGITLVDKPETAECLVGYGVGVQQVVDAVYPDVWVGGGWRGWGPRPWGWSGAWAGGPWIYNQNFIAVDLYDNRSHKPMWHATTDQDLDGVSGAEAAKRIRAAVDAIFTKFPR